MTEYNNAELQARTKEYYHYYHNHYFLSYLDFILHRSKSLSNLFLIYPINSFEKRIDLLDYEVDMLRNENEMLKG